MASLLRSLITKGDLNCPRLSHGKQKKRCVDHRSAMCFSRWLARHLNLQKNALAFKKMLFTIRSNLRCACAWEDGLNHTSITESARQWKINMNEPPSWGSFYGRKDFNGEPLSSLTMVSLISARSLKLLKLISKITPYILYYKKIFWIQNWSLTKPFLFSPYASNIHKFLTALEKALFFPGCISLVPIHECETFM